MKPDFYTYIYWSYLVNGLSVEPSICIRVIFKTLCATGKTWIQIYIVWKGFKILPDGTKEVIRSFLAITDIYVSLIVYFLVLLKDFHPSQCFYMSNHKQGDKGKFVYLYWEQNALAWYIIHAVYILIIKPSYNTAV